MILQELLHTRVNAPFGAVAADRLTLVASGAYAGATTLTGGQYLMASGADGKLLQFDPQVTTLIEEHVSSLGVRQGLGLFQAIVWDATVMPAQMDFTAVKEVAIIADSVGGGVGSADVAMLVNGDGVRVLSASDGVQGGQVVNIRRLNQLGTFAGGVFTPDPMVTRATTNAALLT